MATAERLPSTAERLKQRVVGMDPALAAVTEATAERLPSTAELLPQPAERLAALALAAATGAPAEQLPSAAELLPQPAVKNASGIGGGYMVSGGNISTGENGTAVIFASFIPTSNTTGWKGLIFNVNNGKIYGDSYTVEGALTIPDGKNADSRRRKNAQWWCKHYQQRYH